jgi:Ca2+-binding RTX toxin-like protein
MPTLTVSATTDVRVAPNNLLVLGRDITAITFSSSNATLARFNSDQFGGSDISNTVAITGNSGTQAIEVTLTASGAFSAAGWTFTNWQTGGNDRVRLIGTTGNDSLTGTAFADSLTGGGGSDTLNGGDGDDVFIFRAGDVVTNLDGINQGVETVSGGNGTDALQVASGEFVDFRQGIFNSVELLDFAGAGGATLSGSQIGAGGASPISMVQGATGIQQLQLVGGSFNLSGVGFTDWIAGEDTISISGSGTLIGSANAETITATAGGTTITGGGGADSLNGNLSGDTVFILNAPSDFAAGEQIFAGGGLSTLRLVGAGDYDFRFGFLQALDVIDFQTAGTARFNADQFASTVPTPLPVVGINGDVTFNGGAGVNIVTVDNAVTFTAAEWQFINFSSIDHVDINGTDQNDTITGSSRRDFISGGGGSDVLDSGADNDTLDGGTGADILAGGDGADIYFVDATLDSVIENNADVATGGFDIVVASADFTLQANLEQLVLRGGATVGIGNNGNNFLYGGDSGLALNLDGRDGDDIFFGSLAGHNTLIGGAGVDTLQLFGGNNFANGGTGSDVYFSFTETDTISEAGGDGVDTVFANWNFTMGSGIEQLLLFGSANTAVGSADDNVIFGNSTSGAVNLFGQGGADVIFGGALNDTLSGGAGNDQLFGLGGANTLIGGADNDIYFLASNINTVIELAGDGFDTAFSDRAFTMAANVEQGIIHTTATGITGNGGDEFLFSNSTVAAELSGRGGNDYLRGSDQNDTLNGGTGNDQIDLRGGGNDLVFSDTGNNGNDIVFGFDANPVGGQDLIFAPSSSYSAASLGFDIVTAASGADTLVTFQGGALAGTTLLLVGVAANTINSSDFLFGVP